MKIVRKSILSGTTRELDLPSVTEERLAEWRPGNGQLGRPIQDVFPELNSSEREFLMTGIVDEEWESHPITKKKQS